MVSLSSIPNPPPPGKRPAIVTWVAVAVFLLAVANLIGALTGIYRWDMLAPLNLTIPLPALIALRGIWGIIWLVVGLGLFRLRPWARRWSPFLFLIYELTRIGEVVLFAQTPYSHGRLPFALAVAFVAVNLLTLIMTRPRVRATFDNHS